MNGVIIFLEFEPCDSYGITISQLPELTQLQKNHQSSIRIHQ